MTLWSWLSFAALLAACAPSLYFLKNTRKANIPYALLSLFLAVTLLVHSVFHLLDALESPELTVLSVELASAALLLIFSLAYWPMRRRG